MDRSWSVSGILNNELETIQSYFCESGKRVSNSVYRKKKILEPSVNDNLMIIELPVRFITLFTKANCHLNDATYQDIKMKLSNN